MTFYTISEKLLIKNKKYSDKFRTRQCTVPVCDPCKGLYELWYSIHKKTARFTLRALWGLFWVVTISTFLTFFTPLVFLFLLFDIILIGGVVKSKLDYNEHGSPFRNIKFRWRDKVLVRPDNFKRWVSLQDWVSCTLKSKESEEEIEETFLNYLNENKGSAFSPHALIKRAIGENYTEEYAEKISNLLGLMTQKGIINSKFYDGKFHYFSKESRETRIIEIEESRETQLTEIEETFLNYLNENKGSAFSPHALIKRAIGENYTEEYAEKISNLLGLMTQKGIINSKFYDGKFHYFSS